MLIWFFLLRACFGPKVSKSSICCPTLTYSIKNGMIYCIAAIYSAQGLCILTVELFYYIKKKKISYPIIK